MKIAVLVPCYNEEAAIAKVVHDFRAALPGAAIYVYDNNSGDNTMARAIIAGIVAPGQGELLRPYTRRYFDTISAIWEPSSELAKTIVTGLYPSWDISQVGINAAYEFLAAEMDKALRRLVREGQADVIRALAARKFETHANEESHQ